QTPPRLLAGPSLAGDDPEGFGDHLARLGEVPRDRARHGLIEALEASGLLGRGGAGFPVGRKWRSMAERRDGRAVVVVNGAEGEPASFKDRVLMASRPHLVIDGAMLAADAVGADEIVFYVGEEHGAAVAAMASALDQRRTEMGRRSRLVTAPIGYVSGEATAAVHCINSGDARPTTSPPRMSERGVAGHPTLVQNVESLAYAALIARFGEQWYRSAGRLATRGTALITLSGVGAEDGVREIELGATVGEVAEAAGARRDAIRAVILGGYFGTWAGVDEAWDLPLDPEVMRGSGLTFGCGIVGVLGEGTCGVTAAARIMRFMARESAAQCGPCVYGLDALGSAVTRVATGHARGDDLDRIERLTAITAGRGACHHPDGAVQHMASALTVFGEEFREHARTGRCSITGDHAGVD
ncbi:MAG: NADH-ubiquinone oxidoreductase-F iron-sulfur binding region domain-containing protein, partial [Solirubrobacteraceae bacterium]